MLTMAEYFRDEERRDVLLLIDNFWQPGFFKLNATIVFTWGLMLVLAIGAKLITGRVMDVAAGDGLLGPVIDPLGRPLDGHGPLVVSERLPIESPAMAIMDRAPVTAPF